MVPLAQSAPTSKKEGYRMVNITPLKRCFLFPLFPLPDKSPPHIAKEEKALNKDYDMVRLGTS